ncbi:MAG: CoA transferase [Gemmataceae bacterium]|nr:CoA transferase [Gemmataceae bacterium]
MALQFSDQPKHQRPLEGLVVVDLTRVLAGPFATMILAQLGAKVIKVETPHGGDDSRKFPPFVQGQSLYYNSLNYDKWSIALDLKQDADRALFDRLLSRADFLVENYRPGTMEKLSYSWESLHEKHPQLIYGSVSGFGQTGPMSKYPAYDMVVQALGGVMSLTGYEGQPPVRVGVSIGDMAAGLYLVVALEGALIRRLQGLGGSRVDIAMLDCQVALLEGALANYLTTGTVTRALGSRHYAITPFQSYRTKDSHLILAGGNDRIYALACETIGRPELAHDPRFLSNTDRCQNADAMEVELEKTLQEKTTKEWAELLRSKGVPCAPIQNVAEVANDPQVRARHMIMSMDHPTMGKFQTAGTPVKMTGMPEELEHHPPPELDSDRQAILAWLQG